VCVREPAQRSADRGAGVCVCMSVCTWTCTALCRSWSRCVHVYECVYVNLHSALRVVEQVCACVWVCVREPAHQYYKWLQMVTNGYYWGWPSARLFGWSAADCWASKSPWLKSVVKVYWSKGLWLQWGWPLARLFCWSAADWSWPATNKSISSERKRNSLVFCWERKLWASWLLTCPRK